MKRLIAALGLAVALPLAAANAHTAAPAGTPRDPMQGFTRLDANADGRVTLDEFRTGNERWMARAIARHPDGKLAKASAEQREAMVVRRFERMDANRDAAIDAAEWTAHRNRGFTRLDANADGRVTLAEFRTASEQRIERAIARHPDGKLAKASAAQREAMIVRNFERLDANHDAVIDAAEWAKRPHRHGHHQRRDA